MLPGKPFTAIAYSTNFTVSYTNTLSTNSINFARLKFDCNVTNVKTPIEVTSHSIQVRGSAIFLRRRFNPKTGKVEVIQNGVISRSGYLNLSGNKLNRRQALRNYRYR